MDWVLAVAFFTAMATMEWVGCLRNLPRMPWTYTIIACGLGIYAYFRIRPVRRQLKQLKLGRDGERIVAEQLDVLKREGAFIFHDVPGDGFNLDHVIVCAKGIFVVETKTISKRRSTDLVVFDGEKVTIAGFKPDRDPIVQVSAQTSWLELKLKSMTGRGFAVRGVLVYPGWFIKSTEGAGTSPIWVLEPKALPKWIANEQPGLSKEDGHLIADRLALHIRGG